MLHKILEFSELLVISNIIPLNFQVLHLSTWTSTTLINMAFDLYSNLNHFLDNSKQKSNDFLNPHEHTVIRRTPNHTANISFHISFLRSGITVSIANYQRFMSTIWQVAPQRSHVNIYFKYVQSSSYITFAGPEYKTELNNLLNLHEHMTLS